MFRIDSLSNLSTLLQCLQNDVKIKKTVFNHMDKLYTS